MSSKSSAKFQFLVLCALTGLVIYPAFAHLPLPPKKGDIGRKAVRADVPNFTLVDQDEQRFEFSSARGKLVLATFIFTACPDVCPLLSAKFAAIQRALEEKKAADYLLLSITTDPERDTPAALKSYGANFKAEFARWRFLTGSKNDLKKVWDGFGITVKNPGGQIQHTALTTLIDRDGKRRVDYYTDKWQEKEILRDIASLKAPGAP